MQNLSEFNLTSISADLPGPVLHFVDRPRLDATVPLLAGQSRVAAVWAAAGCGKTSLLRRWARIVLDAKGEVFWLSGAQTSGAPELIARLSDRARRTGQEAYVFLDDVHLSAVSTAINEAIEAADEAVRVVISGRFQPAGSLTFLEATGALVELRTADLAFTPEEIAEFSRLWSIDLQVDSVRSLQTRTGGWVTAAALAMSWLRTADDLNEAVRRFSGDNRAVADYLVTEILVGLEPKEREVLTSAAVRDHVPLELAAVLSGHDDAGSVLHSLSRRNGLIAEQSDGYYFHPVLLSYLKAEARREDLGAASRRAIAASRWYANRDRANEAIGLAIDTADEEVIAEMVERFGLRIVASGRSDLAVHALSRADARSLPTITLRLLLEAPYFTDAKRARHLMAAADRMIAEGATQTKWIVILVALKALAIGFDTGAPDPVAALGSPAAQQERDDNLALDLLASLAEAWTMFGAGRIEDAQASLDDVALSGLNAGYTWLFMTATDLAATIATRVCDWDRARVLDDRLIDAMPTPSLSPTSRAEASVLLASAARSYLVCEPSAGQRLDALIAVDPSGSRFALDVPARMLKAIMHLDADANPRSALQDAHQLFWQYGRAFPRLVAGGALRVVGLDVELDGRERGRESLDLFESILGSDCIETASARFALSAPTRAGDPAEERLMNALRTSAHSWHSGAPISAWLMLAASADQTGRKSEALARLNTALRLAERYHVWRPFLARHGEGAAMLSAQLGRLGPLDAVAAHIVDVARTELSTVPAESEPLQNLTRREHEILLELPIHQSVADIAARQMLSVNTIKTHLRNIYLKLGVTDRRDAVLVAQRHGLL